MKLYEFFSHLNINSDKSQEKTADEKYEMTLEEKEQFKNELFFYILDHDDIHRKHFHDIAEHITDESKPSVWMPIVNKGCMEFHDANKILQHPRDMFDKQMREELCNMLDDHYRKDIKKGEYRP
jgi:hypothetical protein